MSADDEQADWLRQEMIDELVDMRLTWDQLAAKVGPCGCCGPEMTERERRFWFAFKDIGPALGLVDGPERDARFAPLNDRIWGAGNWVKCSICVDNLGNPAYHHRNHHL